jgi:magnesium transporter
MDKIEVDKKFIKQLKLWIDQEASDEIAVNIEEMYPQDIAEVIDKIDIESARYLMSLVEKEKVVKVLVEMEENAREDFLSIYKPSEIAEEFIMKIDSDDAAFILSHLPNKIKDNVISSLSDIEYASQLLALMSYDENTAGSMMAVELISANINWTVAQCVEEIRVQSENVDVIYVVYVVDDLKRLLGLITLKNLILSAPSAKISEVLYDEVISVNTSDENEFIANIFKKYDLVAIPVVDVLGRLVGRITVDDVVDVIKEEADEDYQLMSGITSDVDSSDKAWVLSRARLPWLLIGLLGGIASSRFIEIYEDQLHIHPEMAFFMPLIAAMGGNAGVQSSAIVVQSLANNTLGTRSIFSKLLKEIRVALLNGIVCAGLILAYNLVFNDSINLAYTVSISLISVIIFASLFGTVVPLLLNRVKIDPAIATGPFITTTNDLLGLAIYFSLGHILYTL